MHHAIISNHLILETKLGMSWFHKISTTKRKSTKSFCSCTHLYQNLLHSHWLNCF